MHFFLLNFQKLITIVLQEYNLLELDDTITVAVRCTV